MYTLSRWWTCMSSYLNSYERVMDQTNCFSLGLKNDTSTQCYKHLCQVSSAENCFILKCDINLGSSHTVLAHWALSQDGEHLYQVILYIKLLQPMKGLRTRQPVLSHLTLKCDIDVGSSHKGLAHWTLSQEGEHLYKVILTSCYQWRSYGPDKLFYQIWPWSVTMTFNLST